MEDDQQFCLRWNNHQSTLIQNFDTLLESGTLVDCTLAAEGKYLKAHKVVLSACSPYFEGLLSEHYDKHPVFILKDVKFKELKAMMDYMYRGEVNISQDQLAALLKAAESLQIKGLSESKTSGSSKTDSRQQKVVPQTSQPDIPISSSGLTIEKNKVPRQGVSQGPLGDLPEDSASPQIPKGLSSREGSQSPTSRKRKRFRRKSIGDDNSVENHEASNSSDMPQQMGVPALGIAPVADEKSHADPTDSIGRSALMTQLTKPADEMLQLPLEKPEPSDNLIEPKSEYLEDPEESVEDLTLDDDMNDLNEMEQDNNRAGPSHDPSQHPAGIGAWHVTGDRSNAGGVVGSVAGAPGTTDEVFLAAQEAAQAHRDSQGCVEKRGITSSLTRRKEQQPSGVIVKSECNDSWGSEDDLMQVDLNKWGNDGDSSTDNGHERNDGNDGNENTSKRSRTVPWNKENDRNRNGENCEGDSSETSGSINDLSTNEGWMQPLNQLSSIPINCKYCDKKFIRPANLARHEKNNCLKNKIAKCHTERDANPFVCMKCGARFKHKKALNYHERHMCQRSVKCSMCHKKLTDPMYGQLHSSFIRAEMIARGSMRTEGYQPRRNLVNDPKDESFLYMESGCRQELVSSVSRTHWPDSVSVQSSLPRKKFYCPRCNSGYTRLSDMKTHCHFQCGFRQFAASRMLLSAGQRGRLYRTFVPNSNQRYPCGNCTSVFGQKRSLLTHLRYECGQPPRFKCPYCDLISKKTSNVQKHIRRKHEGNAVYVQDIYRLPNLAV